MAPGTTGTGSSTSDGYPKYGMGFWHSYPYVKDPNFPNDPSKNHVKVHACFLDGHAAPIEINQHDRSGNPIRVDPNNNPYY